MITKIALAIIAALLAPALAQTPKIVTEEMMVPAVDPGIQIYVRNKHQASLTTFRPDRTVLFVHGATYPASTAPPYMAQTLFPLLVNSPGKRYVMLAEGTHTIIMEKNRLELFKTVQSFLDDGGGS
jgi:hypothetical protein